MISEPEIINPNAELAAEGKDLQAEIQITIDAIREGEVTVSANYVRLGDMLLKVRNKRFWLDWDYESWGSYIDSIKTRLDKGRTQIYNCIGAVEQLLPHITEQKLEDMGISKASELARYVRQTGKAPSQNLISLAETSGVDELRSAVFQETHGAPPERTSYFDLGGVYVSAEERKELYEVFSMACQIDPVIQFDWTSPVCRKEVFTRMVQECRGTWEFTIQQEEGLA